MTSFPYLKISREHGVPYGVVIRFAESLEIYAPTTQNWVTQGTWEQATCLAWVNERDRRRMQCPTP